MQTWRYSNSPAIGELETEAYLNRVVYNFQTEFDTKSREAIWFNKKVPLPGLELAQLLERKPSLLPGLPQVLGDTSSKWIEIDLTNQRLYAHEGDSTVYDFPISTGLPWMPTVTGEFHIWAKVRSQRMSGGSVADGTYYSLPNVPFVQYFHKGYGLHGAYWHNDFGKPRSHGCVNMRIPDSEQLFYWTEPQLSDGLGANYHIRPEETIRVVVHGKTPPP